MLNRRGRPKVVVDNVHQAEPQVVAYIGAGAPR